MKRTMIRGLAMASAAVVLASCGDTAQLPEQAGVGPSPTLPAPNTTLIPTVHIATAKGWTDGAKPTPAAGLAVTALATGLQHPRWVYTLPNGDVLVAETNRPSSQGKGGVTGYLMKFVMKQAGAGAPGANRITLLRDADGDGVAELKMVFLKDLTAPFGMALVGETLYVANTDAVVKVPYRTGDTQINAQPQKVADLPGGPLNHHWTKGLVASRDGSKLYVSVGSNSNAGEEGIEAETNRAGILEIDPVSGATRVFASGLRNPVGVAFEPQTNALWTVVNERDELGSDLVPDYLTSVQDGGFYGFPWSYYGRNVDKRVQPERPEMVAKAIVPDYALGNHVAALGLTFADGAKLGDAYTGGAFVGLHGSWNRKPRSGYKVIYVPFANGKPSGQPVDVLTGFLNAAGDAQGRPVGVAIDGRGGLLVADDVGNTIWRVGAANRISAQ